MRIQELFGRFGLKKIRLNMKFAEAEFELDESDSIAAWEMYVELLTRVTTQDLSDCLGDNKSTLDSIYSLFPTTREILKEHEKRSDIHESGDSGFESGGEAFHFEMARAFIRRGFRFLKGIQARPCCAEK